MGGGLSRGRGRGRNGYNDSEDQAALVRFRDQAKRRSSFHFGTLEDVESGDGPGSSAALETVDDATAALQSLLRTRRQSVIPSAQRSTGSGGETARRALMHSGSETSRRRSLMSFNQRMAAEGMGAADTFAPEDSEPGGKLGAVSARSRIAFASEAWGERASSEANSNAPSPIPRASGLRHSASAMRRSARFSDAAVADLVGPERPSLALGPARASPVPAPAAARASPPPPPVPDAPRDSAAVAPRESSGSTAGPTSARSALKAPGTARDSAAAAPRESSGSTTAPISARSALKAPGPRGVPALEIPRPSSKVQMSGPMVLGAGPKPRRLVKALPVAPPGAFFRRRTGSLEGTMPGPRRSWLARLAEALGLVGRRHGSASVYPRSAAYFTAEGGILGLGAGLGLPDSNAGPKPPPRPDRRAPALGGPAAAATSVPSVGGMESRRRSLAASVVGAISALVAAGSGGGGGEDSAGEGAPPPPLPVPSHPAAARALALLQEAAAGGWSRAQDRLEAVLELSSLLGNGEAAELLPWRHPEALRGLAALVAVAATPADEYEFADGATAEEKGAAVVALVAACGSDGGRGALGLLVRPDDLLDLVDSCAGTDIDDDTLAELAEALAQHEDFQRRAAAPRFMDRLLRELEAACKLGEVRLPAACVLAAVITNGGVHHAFVRCGGVRVACALSRHEATRMRDAGVVAVASLLAANAALAGGFQAALPAVEDVAEGGDEGMRGIAQAAAVILRVSGATAEIAAKDAADREASAIGEQWREARRRSSVSHPLNEEAGTASPPPPPLPASASDPLLLAAAVVRGEQLEARRASLLEVSALIHSAAANAGISPPDSVDDIAAAACARPEAEGPAAEADALLAAAAALDVPEGPSPATGGTATPASGGTAMAEIEGLAAALHIGSVASLQVPSGASLPQPRSAASGGTAMAEIEGLAAALHIGSSVSLRGARSSSLPSAMSLAPGGSLRGGGLFAVPGLTLPAVPVPDGSARRPSAPVVVAGPNDKPRSSAELDLLEAVSRRSTHRSRPRDAEGSVKNGQLLGPRSEREREPPRTPVEDYLLHALTQRRESESATARRPSGAEVPRAPSFRGGSSARGPRSARTPGGERAEIAAAVVSASVRSLRAAGLSGLAPTPADPASLVNAAFELGPDVEFEGEGEGEGAAPGPPPLLALGSPSSSEASHASDAPAPAGDGMGPAGPAAALVVPL